MVEKLHVYMNGVLVGELSRNRQGLLTFCYASNWLSSPTAHPLSLSLGLRASPWRGDIVLQFFSNLLPDSPALLERIDRRLSIGSTHPFDLLAVIGRDCAGALQLIPDGEKYTPLTIQAKALSVSDIESLLSDLSKRPLGMAVDGNFRLSIAGAQEKTALLKMNGQWMLPYGATPTTHIFKLPIGVLNANTLDLSTSCENEFLCLKIAQAYGIEAANAEIVQFGSQKALAVERFDRKWLSTDTLLRLPTEDFCQALGVSSALKYESDGGPSVSSIMHLLRYSTRPQQDCLSFFKAQILYWLLGNTDGHAKNFSIFLMPSGYRLTPLYDILSVWPLVKSGGLPVQKLKLAMAQLGKNRHYKLSEISGRHFLATAVRSGMTETLARHVIEEMALQTTSVIERVAKKLPKEFPEDVAEAIFQGMQSQANRLLSDASYRQ